jgi:hypothetical protein
VFDAAADEPTARPSERALSAGDEADRRANAAAGRARDREDDRSNRRIGRRRPHQRSRAGRVDLQDREIAVHVLAEQTPAGVPAVREDTGGFVAVNVVGVGEDAVLGDYHARPAAPTSADADHSGCRARANSCHGLLQFVQRAHRSLLGPPDESAAAVCEWN